MIHQVSLDTKNPLPFRADPKIAIVVEDHTADTEAAAVEGGRHKWLEDTLCQSSKPSPGPVSEYADPEGAIGTTRQASDPGLACVGFQSFDRIAF